MEQFKFPLQKLLDIRIDKEEKNKHKFMEAQREKRLVEVKIDGLEQNYKKYSAFTGNESTVDRKIKNYYLNALNYAINDAKDDLVKKDKVVDSRREELMQSQIERKTVDILKEKKLSAFIAEENRLEQIRNDEFALYSFIRSIERG